MSRQQDVSPLQKKKMPSCIKSFENSEAHFRRLSQENKRLKAEIDNVATISHQLVNVLGRVQTMCVTEEPTHLLSPQLKEELELALLLGEILDTGSTPDEWIGRYIVGAREEAKSIIRQALAVSEIISEPSIVISREKRNRSIRRKVTSNLEITPPKDISKGYQGRLSKVAKTYESQCDDLREILDGQATSIINKKVQKRGVSDV